jgi:hypothetical protein
MGQQYSTVSAVGYNSAPPPDDGSQVAANLITWATHKNKLADPLHVQIDAINAGLVAYTNFSVRQITASDNTVIGDHLRCVEIAPNVSTAVTVFLGDAVTMTSVYRVFIKNSSPLPQTIGRVTSGNTINGVAANISIFPGDGLLLQTNSTPNGYLTLQAAGPVMLSFDSYGAIGDGSIDDTVAMQRAIAAGKLLGNCIVYGTPGKTYKITGSLLVDGDGVILDFRGSTLKPTGSSNYFAIQFAGSGLGTSTDVTVDAARGVRAITVASVANAAPGDYLHVMEDTGTIQWLLTARILTEVGSVWTLDTPLPFTITAANAQTVAKWTPISYVGLRNVHIDGSAWTGTACVGVAVYDVAFGVFEDIRITGNNWGKGFESFRGYRNKYDNIELYQAGGGTIVDQDFQIGRETASTIRCIKSVGSYGFGPTIVMGSYCNISDVTSINTAERGFKLQQSVNCTVANVQVIGAGTTGFGVVVGSQYNAISNITAVKAGTKGTAGVQYGIWLDAASNNNNVISNIQSYANGEFDIIAQSGSSGNIFDNVRVSDMTKIQLNGNPVMNINGDLGIFVSDDTGSGGPTFWVDRYSASPAVNDVLGVFNFSGRNSAASRVTYASMRAIIADATAGSEDVQFALQALVAGAAVDQIYFGNGVQIGAPTGGFLGTGKLNVAVDVFKNNTAYNNPDYVFEKAFTGEISRFADSPGAKDYTGPVPLDSLEAFVREKLHLPRVSRDPAGMFERSDIVLEKLEELTLYVIELHKRLTALESR